MIDSRLKEYFENAKMILDKLGIEYGNVTDVSVNTRAKSRWGQCIYDKASDSYRITINSLLLDETVSYKAVMDTVIHELLHCHKDRFCHTGEWKRCANLVNMRFGYNIKRTTSAAEKNIEPSALSTGEVKYVVTCECCGASSKYKRRSKIVKLVSANPYGSCRCGCCGGTSFTLDIL